MDKIQSITFKAYNDANRIVVINDKEFIISESMINMIARCSKNYRQLKEEHGELKADFNRQADSCTMMQLKVVRLERTKRDYDDLAAQLQQMITRMTR